MMDRTKHSNARLNRPPSGCFPFSPLPSVPHRFAFVFCVRGHKLQRSEHTFLPALLIMSNAFFQMNHETFRVCVCTLLFYVYIFRGAATAANTCFSWHEIDCDILLYCALARSVSSCESASSGECSHCPVLFSSCIDLQQKNGVWC